MPDLADSRGAVAEQVKQLHSRDEARARMAEMRLGCAGAAALDALEAEAGDPSPRMRARLDRILDLGLRTTFTEVDLGRHPRLLRLARPKLEAAEWLGDSLATRHSVGKLIARGGNGRDRDGDRRMIGLGGYAVPKAVRMLHDPRRIARVVGIQTIHGTYALIAAGELEAIQASPDSFGTDEDCFVSPHTIGGFATDIRRQLEIFWKPGSGYEWPIACLSARFGGDPGYEDLIHGIRESAGELSGGPMTVKGWDEWWTRAWPAWRDWWDLSGESGRPANLDEWWNTISSYRGYRIDRERTPDGASEIEVVGSRDAVVEVVEFDPQDRDSLMLVRGSPPLTCRVSRDSALAMGWEIPKNDRESSQAMTRVRVLLPNGRQWEEPFVSFAGSRWRLEILNPPRRADQRLR